MAARRLSRRMLAKAVAARLASPAAKRPQLVRGLAAYLITNKMVHELDMLMSDIARELAQTQGHLFASVTSAHELSQGLQRDIAAFLRTQTKATHVELVSAVDPELIGGIQVRTPDLQLDSSVQRKLKRLAHIGEN